MYSKLRRTFGKGWRKDPIEHGLAAKGIKTREKHMLVETKRGLVLMPKSQYDKIVRKPVTRNKDEQVISTPTADDKSREHKSFVRQMLKSSRAPTQTTSSLTASDVTHKEARERLFESTKY